MVVSMLVSFDDFGAEATTAATIMTKTVKINRRGRLQNDQLFLNHARYKNTR